MSFYSRIKDQVAEVTSKFNYQNDGTAFGHFIIKECFSKIVDLDYNGTDLDGFIKDHIVDMANDLGNDAIFVNQRNKEIYVFQFKYSNNQLLNTIEIKKNKKFIDWVLKLNPASLSPNYKLAKIIDDDISPILSEENMAGNNYSIIFYYIDNNYSDSIKTDIKALFTNYKDKQINFQIKFYNYEELEELYDDIEIPKNEVKLKIIPAEYFIKKINYHDDTDTEVETIVISIVANSLKPIIEDKKELILALNVRYYKGENDINSNIIKEYSKGKRSNFWILNNGINAICEDFNIEEDYLHIKNFQIVNGGQTTKTLERIVNDLPDDVQILMRLTKIQDKTKTSKISKEIAVASNSQNAISYRDLHSGDRIQTKIFDKLDSVGIFYDKKDGEWATVNKKKYSNPTGISPRYLKIQNIDLGISYLSLYLQIPISSAGRKKLVFSDLFYYQIFSMENNEDEQFYKLMLAFRISEEISKIREQYFSSFEILQNNYINDVLVSLSGIYFFKDNLSSIGNLNELTSCLENLDAKQYINLSERYSLNLNEQFSGFIYSKVIESIQYWLDVKKEAKKSTGNDWLPTDTNNWLKKDSTYKEIYDIVLKRAKR